MKTPIQVTVDQLNAINAVKAFFGKKWKTELSRCWAKGSYPEPIQSHSAELQRMRNTIGSKLMLAKELVARM